MEKEAEIISKIGRKYFYTLNDRVQEGKITVNLIKRIAHAMHPHLLSVFENKVII